MITVKTFLLLAFSLNILALVIISVNQYSQIKSYQLHQQTSTYSFDDPLMAFYLLEKLDVHSAIPEKAIPGANYSRPASGLKINFDYCSQNRAYFANHPEYLFEQQNVVSNYWNSHKLIKQVFPMINANDVQPELYPRKNINPKDFVYDLKPEATVFYTQNLFFYIRQVGKQFSCLTQASNHIPGHDKVYRKDFAAQALVDYADSYKSRPSCFNFNEFFPKTWVLQNQTQCNDFFAEFNSSYYQKLKKERNVVYFRKIGADAHEGSGVFPVTNEEENKIRNLYGNGSLCGQVRANNLIQYNVYNPLLLENRKFGFRMFMLVASTNPVIAYYHDGYLRLSIDEYNADSKDIKTFVTNIGVNLKEAQKDSLFEGMSEEQIHEYTCWFLDKFQDYMLEKQIINDPNWLDNYLRPQFKKVMIHLIRMSQDAFFKKSSVFELYGLDFVMDANLGLWYIETNTMPLVNGFTKGSTELMNRMLADTFEIIFGLVRSRMKRVIIYINELSGQLAGQKDFQVPDLELRREEFRKITMNRFEPEFEPSVNNTFQKIIDENEVGVQRYFDLLESDCL